MRNIYHYTSLKGFESIINSNSFWMFRSDFMNDPNDCKIFFDIVTRYIDTLSIKDIIKEKSIEHPNQTLQLAKKFPVIDYMEYVKRNIGMYLISTTSKSDSLPMWNYYGGNGIELAFNDAEIHFAISDKLCKKQFQFTVLTNVEYIDTDIDLLSLKLDSFSDFRVYEYSESESKVISRDNSIFHDEGESLKYYIDSYVYSYLNTISYFCREAERNFLDINYLINTNDKNEFFKSIFIANRNTIKKNGLEFKADIDIFMLVLSTRYKPKTFENEEETRIVFFDYNLDEHGNEKYISYDTPFGTCFKPYIKCDFEEERISQYIKSIILSPITAKMPFDINTYIEIIKRMVNKSDSEDFVIKLSEHNIRW